LRSQKRTPNADHTVYTMDRNTVIGIILIFGLFYLWAQINAPTEEELAEAQRLQDSIAMVEQGADLEKNGQTEGEPEVAAITDETSDSLTKNVEEQFYSLSNEQLELSISNMGGIIGEARIKGYQRVAIDETGEEYYAPLSLMTDPDHKYEYIIPKSSGGYINTGDLAFSVEQTSDRMLELYASLPQGGKVTFRYILAESGYQLDFQTDFSGLDAYIQPQESIQFNWVNVLERQEKPDGYEETYTTVHYKTVENSPTSLSWTADDNEQIEESLNWVSHANQFFNSTFMSESTYAGGELDIQNIENQRDKLKIARSSFIHKITNPKEDRIDQRLYIGPNDFEAMKTMGHELEDVIPYGWSIFGTINRWVIRPVFAFFSTYIGSLGIAIIILTFVIKFALYPLTYKMLHSQAKMAALKPEIAKIKEKNKDDSSAQQMETMKLYREFGVNPLGGCMPMVLQMPIWFALYRFFPASIEFRQESFLWAEDLSTYDVFFELPFYIPAYGSHISLFTLLWAVSLFGYTMYNMKNMDTSMMQSNPMMKYMQYLMPVMFLFFLNSYSSGLTCYLLFSNIFNISQTAITKSFIFNDEKIKSELNRNKEKPKKKSGFRARLEQAMEEQRKTQEKKKGKK